MADVNRPPNVLMLCILPQESCSFLAFLEVHFAVSKAPKYYNTWIIMREEVLFIHIYTDLTYAYLGKSFCSIKVFPCLVSFSFLFWSLNTVRANPHKIVKHTQAICRLLPTNCFTVFDHFVGLTFKGLTVIR